jgi:phosphoinositide-3-kinase regulatory subunit 4
LEPSDTQLEISSNLIYGTTHGSVTILDLRTMRVLQQLDNPTHFGSITTMCLDKNRTWLVTGTLSGMLVLWDLRFGLLLRSWKVGSAIQPGIATRVNACSIHPVQSQWVVVASETRPHAGDTQGTVLVEIWNIETGQLVECLVTREPSRAHQGQDATVVASNANSFVASTHSSPADAIAMLVHSRGVKGREESLSATEEIAADRTVWQPDVRALAIGREFGGQSVAPMLTVTEDFVLTGGRYTIPSRRQRNELGFIITGSEDRKLRLWHLGRVESSMLISGGDPQRPAPTFRSVRLSVPTEKFLIFSFPSTIRDASGGSPYHTETWQNWQENAHDRQQNTFRSRLIGQHQKDLLQGHQDCISAVCYIDSPFRGGIISGDRSGYIKIFKVSLGEK